MKPKLQKILHEIRHNSHRRIQIFKALKDYEKREVFFRLSKLIQKGLVSKMDDASLVSFLEYLDPDEAADVVFLLSPLRKKVVLKKVQSDVRRDLETLLKFDPETAGGIMNLDYIQAEDTDPLSVVGKKIHLHEKRTGKMPVVLIMKKGRLVGYLPGRALAFGSPKEPVIKYRKRIAKIPHHKTREQIIEAFREHPHDKMVVVDDYNKVLGVIYSDDILKLVHEMESQSLYEFAGVSKQETVYDSIRQKVNFRYKWLILNLATAFLAASVVGLFDNVISTFVLLAVYMPIVAGMGGNAATQTLAVMVRAIALDQISLKSFWPALRKEAGSALINGLINGILVASIVILISKDYWMAGILAVAMVLNLIVAAIFGTLIPLIMVKLNKDPASSATVFITTATDVFGFLAFLGLATIFLL